MPRGILCDLSLVHIKTVKKSILSVLQKKKKWNSTKFTTYMYFSIMNHLPSPTDMNLHPLSFPYTLILQIAIYQITDTDLCNQILTLHKNGIKVSIIVSARIVSYTDWKLAQQCYGTLHDEGVSIRKALTKFSFAHQKYWVIDNKEVHLSTG